MQILTNASLGEAVQEATSTFAEAPSLLGDGAAGLAGMFFGKISRGFIAPLIPGLAPGGAIANVIGGALGVVGARFFSSFFGTRVEAAATIGALVDAMMPVSTFAKQQIANMPQFPGKQNVVAALGSYYMTPYTMGSEYALAARTLEGFSRGDFGDGASENFPSISALGGIAPDFSNNNSQYGEDYLGAWTPELDLV